MNNCNHIKCIEHGCEICCDCFHLTGNKGRYKYPEDLDLNVLFKQIENQVEDEYYETFKPEENTFLHKIKRKVKQYLRRKLEIK